MKESEKINVIDIKMSKVYGINAFTIFSPILLKIS